MALGTPVAGAAAYSASGGTTVAPAYPSGILATDVVLLFLGQKPSTANGGTATTPAGWTLRDELLAAGRELLQVPAAGRAAAPRQVEAARPAVRSRRTAEGKGDRVLGGRAE